MNFNDLGLKESSLQAIEKLGFKSPTEIQILSIPMLLKSEQDFVGQAQTGTGKTAAFSLPLMERINLDEIVPQALVIAPTRELANQITQFMDKLAEFDDIRTVAVYGGTPIQDQIYKLRSLRPQVVVGTPGRLMDLINRKALKISGCRYIVLDEADEMLDMGFLEDIEWILDQIPQKHTWMFSATMPPQIKKLVEKQFNEPQFVKVVSKQLAATSVKQYYAIVRREHQFEALERFLQVNPEVYGIIFCQTKVQTGEISSKLAEMGIRNEALHGDMGQDHRDLAMKNFKERKVRLMVCTDVAARGIDVDDLTHVINFSLPQNDESYVHRIGRTGRGGRTGVSFTLITPNEMGRLSKLQHLIGSKMEKWTLPNSEMLLEVAKNAAIEEIYAGMMEMEQTPSELKENLVNELNTFDREELLNYLAFHMYSKKLKPLMSKNTRHDINFQTRDNNQSSGGRYQSIRINLGKMDKVGPRDIVEFLCRYSSIRPNNIGKVRILEKSSVIAVDSSKQKMVLKMKPVKFQNRSIKVSLDSQNNGGPRRRSYSRR